MASSDLIHLSAAEFVKALQGERPVQDVEGRKHTFFYTKYKIDDSTLENVVIIDQIRLTEAVVLEEEMIFPYAVIIKGGEFQAGFWILGGEFKAVFQIEGGEFQADFWIQGGVFKRVRIFGPNTSIFQLVLSAYVTWEIVLESNCRIKSLILFGNIKPSGALYLKNISLSELRLVDFENEGVLSLSRVVASSQNSDIETKLLIKNSNLGKATFLDVDFNSFTHKVISGSKINNISTVKTHIPLKGIYTNFKETEKGKIQKEQNPQELSEIYNQLYLAMQKQGNRQMEMEYYAQYLHWQLKAYWQEKPKNWAGIVSLEFNRFSTNYSTNWLQGVLGILLIAFFFYIVTSMAMGYIYYEPETVFYYLQKHIIQFTKFLLPTHDFNFINGRELNAWAIIFDLLGRIFIAFWVYQTITAFRRFGRK